MACQACHCSAVTVVMIVMMTMSSQSLIPPTLPRSSKMIPKDDPKESSNQVWLGAKPNVAPSSGIHFGS